MKYSIKRSQPKTALALLAALLLSAACLRPAAAAQPAVLEQIPDDAAAVLVVTNVKLFSAHLANLGVRMGLQLPPDPMGLALRNVRIVKGFDANNSAALVLLKPVEPKEAAAPEDADAPKTPPAVLLLPTTDSKLMLEQWEPGDPDKSGISEVSLPTGRMARGFVATTGNYVAFAQDHDVLARFLARKQPLSKTLPADAAKAMDKNDLVLYANVPAFAKTALDAVEKQQEEIIGMMDLLNLQSGNETSAALRKQQLTIVFDGTKQFLKDANTGLLTLRLGEAGVNLGAAGQFKQDSALGKFVLSQKTTRVPTLAGLPEAPFGAAGAMVIEPKALAQWLGDLMARTLTDPVVAKDPRIDEFKKGVELTRQSVGLMEASRAVFYAPPEDPKKSRLNGAMIIDTSDAAKYLALQMDMLKNPLSTETMDPDLTSTAAVTPDAITVKGVKFTKVVHKIQLREETPEHPLPPTAKTSYNSIAALYGAEGMVMYMGSIDKKVLVIMGSEPATIESVVDAVQKKSDVLATSKAITTANEQLVANPVLVTYVSVEPWLAVFENMIRQAIGKPQDKADAPAVREPASAPTVFSVGLTETTVNAEVHVPVSALSNIAKWGMNLKSVLTGEEEMPPMPAPPPEK
jgi:hypothetical protein